MKPLSPRPAGTRLYCDLPLSPGAEIVLPESAARHAVTVLRLQIGDTFSLFLYCWVDAITLSTGAWWFEACPAL